MYRVIGLLTIAFFVVGTASCLSVIPSSSVPYEITRKVSVPADIKRLSNNVPFEVLVPQWMPAGIKLKEFYAGPDVQCVGAVPKEEERRAALECPWMVMVTYGKPDMLRKNRSGAVYIKQTNGTWNFPSGKFLFDDGYGTLSVKNVKIVIDSPYKEADVRRIAESLTPVGEF